MSCLFPVGYKVTFDGENLGDEIVKYISDWKLATAENVRHNFWSHTPTIDCTYPALVWEHNFTIYCERATRGAYAKAYFDTILTCVATRAMQLLVTNKSTDEDILAMGRCVFVGSNQDTPDELLRYEAGFFRLKFLGTAVPSLVSSY